MALYVGDEEEERAEIRGSVAGKSVQNAVIKRGVYT